MWPILIAGGLYMFRSQITKVLEPVLSKFRHYLPETTPQKNAFYGHLLVLVGGVVYVLPIEFVGLGGMKRMAYLISLWSTIATSGMLIKVNYGTPPVPQISGFSMAALKELMPAMQPWLQKVLLSVDFHFLFFSLIFVAANPSLFALLILGRRSLWTVCSYCTKNAEAQGRVWQLFKPMWEKLQQKEPEVLQQSALAEIMLGVWLAVSLAMPSRQILTCFLYWNYLKTRFQAPKSAKHHVKAWGQIGATAQPVLKMAPFLSKPIDMAKDWFKPKYQMQ